MSNFRKDNCDVSENYVVYDFETSGLNVNACEILEIGAVEVQDGEIVRTFSSLCKPYRYVHPAALKVNKLKLKDLEKAPLIEDVLPEFLDFVGNSTLIGFNSDNYDMRILMRYINKMGLEHEISRTEDVYNLALSKRLPTKNNRLVTICEYFGIDTTNAHRALDDSIMTYKCYELLKKM